MKDFKIEGIDIKSYRKDGYIILKDFFSDEALREWELAVVKRFAFQAHRIGAIKKCLPIGKPLSDYRTVEDLDTLLLNFEEIDQHAAFIANGLLADTIGARKLWMQSKLTEVASFILKCPEEHLVLPSHYPSLFISIPSNPRLRYTWHSEANCCFPKRRNLLTFWFPTFRDKTADNGTMFLKRGSYVKNYTYVNSKSPDSPLKQFYLPDYEHSEFEEVPMVCNRGDLVIFEGNMVHRGSENSTAKISYTTVMRAFDYSHDMTLSRAETASFAQEDYGRFDLECVNYN